MYGTSGQLGQEQITDENETGCHMPSAALWMLRAGTQRSLPPLREVARTCRTLSAGVVSEGASGAEAEASPSPSPGLQACSVRSALHSRMQYSRSWAWQQTLLNRRLDYRRRCRGEGGGTGGRAGPPPGGDVDRDCLLLFEHEHVYTLGRGADEENLTLLAEEPDGGAAKRLLLGRGARGPGTPRLAVDRLNVDLCGGEEEEEVDALSSCASPVLAPNGATIYRVERGGEVTYHGPGQLVGYPMVDLASPPYLRDLHWYLRMVEEVVMETLKHYDIESSRDEINTGVWVGQDKIAAVGISSSRWITTHGFAINVQPDLEYFDAIVPCGIEDRGVTSIAKVVRDRGDERYIPALVDVATVALCCFERVFGVELLRGKSLR